MLGHVGPEEARVWAAASAPAELGVWLSTSPALENPVRVSGPRLTADSGLSGHVRVTGLRPGTRYFYCLTLDGVPAQLPPYPALTTAPPEGEPGRVRVAVASCVGYRGFAATAGYADMARTNLDLLLMIGDNHYANTNDLDIQRRFYADQRATAGWRGLAPGLPIYAIWDDHDYGPDNSNGRMPGKEKSLQAFREAWANPAYGEPDNPGVYFKLRRGNIDFFLLDGRYYRDPNRATNLQHKTMLGARQLAWLKRELKASDAPLKVLVSGGEWQTHGTDDSWTSFAAERNEILGFLDENRIQGVLLVSGDRHFTAGYHVRGRWVEVTSGPIGSAPATVKNSPEMFFNLSETKGHYYCVFDLDTRPSPPQVTLEVYRVGDGLALRRAFTWDELTGARRIPSLPKEKDAKSEPKAETKSQPKPAGKGDGTGPATKPR
jgi:alkaline phosphatase D